MPASPLAAIFDLDGVLTSTSARHQQSWSDAAERFGFAVTKASLSRTRSVPREASLQALLEDSGVTMDASARNAVMSFKDRRYKELIAGLGPQDAFPGAREALEVCRGMGLSIAVASASLNADVVLARLGLTGLVDLIADPRRAASKPDPQIYAQCCEALNVSREAVVCIEDSRQIITNLRLAGFYTVGISHDPLDADEQFGSLADWDVSHTVDRLKARL
jgi:beta-phosphoglucomutase